MDEPDPFIMLITASTEFEADLIASAMQARGVDAHVQRNFIATNIFGMLGGGTGVLVRHSHAVDAIAYLREVWGDQRVGASVMTSRSACPACRYDLSGLDGAERCPECGVGLVHLPGIGYMLEARDQVEHLNRQTGMGRYIGMVAILAALLILPPGAFLLVRTVCQRFAPWLTDAAPLVVVLVIAVVIVLALRSTRKPPPDRA